MSEQIGVVLIFVGLGLLSVGLISLAIRGIPVLLGRGSARRLRWSLALVAGGLVVGALPFVWQEAYLAIVGLGPRERVIEGSPTSLDGLKDILLTDAMNLLVVPEGRLGHDLAAAGVGARFHKGFTDALADI